MDESYVTNPDTDVPISPGIALVIVPVKSSFVRGGCADNDVKVDCTRWVGTPPSNAKKDAVWNWNAEKAGGVVGMLTFGTNGLLLLLRVSSRREKKEPALTSA